MHKFVVVDDEPLILEGFQHAIDWRTHNYELVETFQSPLQLVDFCKKHTPPDLTFLDMNIPDADGIAALKKMKNLYPQMKVIMLAAFNEYSYAKEALRCQADEYLWKSELKFEDILSCMDTVFENDVRANAVCDAKANDVCEFADYDPNSSHFSAAAFKNILDRCEKHLSMGNVTLLGAALGDLWKMIVESRPSKKQIFGGVCYLVYLCMRCAKNVNENMQEDYDMRVLQCFCRQLSYRTFVENIRTIFMRLLIVMEGKNKNEALHDKIEDYMENHLELSDLNLMQLSKAMGVSYSYFSKRFATIMGENFSKYLVGKRMRKACCYLKYSDYTIEKILELVGYIDKSYFVKSFRQYTGITPHRYRMTYREKDGDKAAQIKTR